MNKSQRIMLFKISNTTHSEKIRKIVLKKLAEYFGCNYTMSDVFEGKKHG